MSVIFMPYDKEETKTIFENVRRNSLENIFITQNYSKVLENAREFKALDYDYGIAMRHSEEGLTEDLTIICSGKNPIPEKALKLIKNLKDGGVVKVAKSPFVYKDNTHLQEFNVKTEVKTYKGSWYAEISAGEQIEKPAFIIVIGDNNYKNLEELEKELIYIINEKKDEIRSQILSAPEKPKEQLRSGFSLNLK